jgi:hypothetical protein
MGISNGVGTLAGMLCPVTVEFLTKKGVKYRVELSFFSLFFFSRHVKNGPMYF